MHKDTDVSTEDHVWLEEFEVGDVLVASLKFAHVADVLELVDNKWAVRVTFAVDESQDVVAVFPTILARQPSGRFGHEEHGEEETDCR